MSDGISFKLAPAKKKRAKPSSTLVSQVASSREEIKGLSGGSVLVTKQREAKKALVIPCIDGIASQSNSLDDLAAQEVLRDLEVEESGGERRNLTVALRDNNEGAAKDQPMLIRNMVPGLKEVDDEKERFALDMSIRPDDLGVKSEAYDTVPIEDFGAAMLRGMGWTPDTGVGIGKNQKVVKPYLLENRPTLLGLGATPKPEDTKTRKIIAPGEKRPEKRVWLCVGAVVRLSQGKHEGEHAVVAKIDSVPGLDNVIVHLDPGVDAEPGARLPETVIKRSWLTLVDVARLPERHAALELLEIHRAQMRLDKSKDGGGGNGIDDGGGGPSGMGNAKKRTRYEDERRCEHSDRHRKRDKHSKKRKRAADGEGSRKSRNTCWLLPGIRVRIVSKNIAAGLYAQKGIVQDVLDLGARTCILATGDSSSAIHEHVPQRKLETALPKAGGEVVVVLGAKRGARGKLLQRSSAKDKAVVQLYGEQIVETLRFEQVAEYVGSSDLDYLC